jgi:hypothetical protein
VSRRRYTLVCAVCAMTFTARRRDARFCSSACRQAGTRDKPVRPGPSPEPRGLNPYQHETPTGMVETHPGLPRKTHGRWVAPPGVLDVSRSGRIADTGVRIEDHDEDPADVKQIRAIVLAVVLAVEFETEEEIAWLERAVRRTEQEIKQLGALRRWAKRYGVVLPE